MPQHLLQMTSLCLGISNCLIALPMISSLMPLEYTFAVSHVLRPRSHAPFSSSRPSFSSITQSIQSLWPNDMAPRMGRETRRPDDPSWTYETFVPSRLPCSSLGTGGRVDMLSYISVCFSIVCVRRRKK